MTDEHTVSTWLFNFLDEALRTYFCPAGVSSPRMRRADVEKLLSDDVQRRLAQTRLAATSWGATETRCHVEMTAERMLVTERGLLYAVRMNTRAGRPLYFVATPPALFEPIVDRVAAAPLPSRSAAAVDDRFGHDLMFPWPLDAALRRLLDAHVVLRMQMTPN